MGVSIMHSNMYLAGYTYFNFLISFLLRWITFREYLAMISFCPSKIFSCWNSIFLNLKSGHDAGPIKQLVLLAGEPISKVLLHVRTEVEAKDWRCGTVSPSCFSRALYLLDMVVTFSSLSALDNSLDNGCFPKDFVDVRIWWFISPRALNSDRSTSLLLSDPTCYLHRSLAGSEFSRFLIGLIWFACA